MKYNLLRKSEYGYSRHGNDSGLSILEDFLMLDVGPHADSFLEFLTTNSQKSNAGNLCLLIKEEEKINLAYCHDDTRTVYLSMTNEQMQQVLRSWEKVYSQSSLYILIVKNEKNEINLESFDTDEQISNRIQLLGLKYSTDDRQNEEDEKTTGEENIRGYRSFFPNHWTIQELESRLKQAFESSEKKEYRLKCGEWLVCSVIKPENINVRMIFDNQGKVRNAYPFFPHSEESFVEFKEK